MQIAFRCDASTTIGSGHVMRCKTLADELRRRGAEVRFVCRDYPGNMISFLQGAGYATAVLPRVAATQAEDAAQTLKALEGFAPDWLIADHYGLDEAWERALRAVARRIFVIDDLADRVHDCDMLLDQNAHENPGARYEGKMPATCTALFGPRYALLRREFQTAKHELKRQRGPIRRVLVTFGGADATNETLGVLNVLGKPPFASLEVEVVIGAGHPDKNKISLLCAQHPGWQLHCGTDQMASLMAKADVAIGAGGITTWERIYLGMPALVKVVAANQAEALEYLAGLGLLNLWQTDEELAELLAAHLQSGLELPPFDIHFGTNEVAERILQSVSLVQFCVQHVRRTYKWLVDPQLREAFMSPTVPTVKGHCQYWRTEFTNPAQAVFAIYSGAAHVGNCGLKYVQPQEHTAELWIYLGSRSGRGTGIGDAALRLLEGEARKRISPGKLYLHVGKANMAAVALYSKAGFVPTESPIAEKWGARISEVLCMVKQC